MIHNSIVIVLFMSVLKKNSHPSMLPIQNTFLGFITLRRLYVGVPCIRRCFFPILSMHCTFLCFVSSIMYTATHYTQFDVPLIKNCFYIEQQKDEDALHIILRILYKEICLAENY